RRQAARYLMLAKSLGIPRAGDLLTQSLLRISNLEAAVSRLDRQFEADRDAVATSIKHIGLVRFNAFGDIGGGQSFSLAAADSNGDGVILTALHSREEFRFYAKPLKSWSSTYPLSREEGEAIDAARSRKPRT
ncbi:MAG TPA: DUF4446 family protein, partial [Firmicutes bacterium]|nr:DUF4446 family protein [Bacillota bacterium]